MNLWNQRLFLTATSEIQIPLPPQTHRHIHDFFFFLMCNMRSFTCIYRRDCVGNFKRVKLQLGVKFSQAMEDFPCVING